MLSFRCRIVSAAVCTGDSECTGGFVSLVRAETRGLRPTGRVEGLSASPQISVYCIVLSLWGSVIALYFVFLRERGLTQQELFLFYCRVHATYDLSRGPYIDGSCIWRMIYDACCGRSRASLHRLKIGLQDRRLMYTQKKLCDAARSALDIRAESLCI